MEHLGTIHGVGRLVVNAADVCEARYHINVYKNERTGFNTANDNIEADSDELHRAWSTGATCLLRLETGDEIIITIDDFTDTGVTIGANGPIPGF